MIRMLGSITLGMFLSLACLHAADPVLPSLSMDGGQAGKLQLRAGKHPGLFTYETISVTGQSFTAAWRLTGLLPPEKPWSFQALSDITGGLHPGDLLVIGFNARSVAAGPDGTAKVQVFVQQDREPWTKAFIHDVPITSEWSSYRFACAIDKEFPVGGAQVGVFLGFGPQTIEIGGASFENRGRVELASQADAAQLTIISAGAKP